MNDRRAKALGRCASSSGKRAIFRAVIPLAVACSTASAAIDTWTGNTGNWSDGANWTDQKAPVSGETAVVNTMNGSAVTVTLDVSTTIAKLIIEAINGKLTFQQSNLTVLVSGDEYIGFNGPGAYSQMVNGAAEGLNSVNGNIYIGGASPSGAGVYFLSASGAAASTLCIGGNTTAAVASGLLTISSNSVVTCRTLQVWNTSGTGLVLSGGSLAAGTIAGLVPGSNFTWTSGTLSITGAAGFSSAQVPNLNVAARQELDVSTALNLTAGALSLSGGTITAKTIDTTGNPSGFNWTSGRLWLVPSTASPYTLSSSNLGPDLTLSAGKSFVLGRLVFPSGPALAIPSGTSLTLSGGSLSAIAIDTTGNPSGLKWSSGSITLLGTTASTFTLSSTNVGPDLALSVGKIFTLPGTLVIPANTSIALTGGSLSAYAIDLSSNFAGMNWSAGTLAITKPLTGPTLRVGPGQTLLLNNSLGNPGTAPITLDGGSITAQGFDSHSSGFVWNSGKLSMVTSNAPSILNSLTVSAQNIGMNVSIDQSKSFSYYGMTSFPEGSNLAITGGVFTSYGLSLDGVTTLSSGGLNAIVNLYSSGNGEAIGQSGAAATFTQSGGNNTLSSLDPGGRKSNLHLGPNAKYFLSGGSLHAFDQYIDGTFTQTGGSNQVGPPSTDRDPQTSFNVGETGAPGTYNLNDGGHLTVFGVEIIGPGTFNQSGGSNTITVGGEDISYALGGLTINSSGFYNFSTGTLSIVAKPGIYPAHELIGGTFVQSGGTQLLTGDLQIGLVANGGGVLRLSDGTVSLQNFQGPSSNPLNIGGNIGVGGSLSQSVGAGLLEITGGSINALRTVKIWNTPGTGVVLAGGTLSAGSIDTSGNPSRFSWSAGTLVITGAGGLTLSNSTVRTAFILGQGQTLNVSNALTVPAGGLLTVDGGALSAGALVLSGGNAILNQGSVSTSALTIDASSQLDLRAADMVVTYTSTSPLPAIRSLIASGYNHGTWSGGGITSSTAASDPSHVTAIGYAETADLPNFLLAGPSNNGVIVELASFGDANLDGAVDLIDFTYFINGLASFAGGWESGDFNYDGITDVADFSLFLSGFTASGGQDADLSAMVAGSSMLSSAQKAQLVSLIPEPAGAAIALVGLIGLRRHRTVGR